MSHPPPARDYRAPGSSAAGAGGPPSRLVQYSAAASAESSRPSTSTAGRSEGHGGSSAPSTMAGPVPRTGSDSRRTSTESAALGPSRTLGMHSILNPPADTADRGSSHLDSTAAGTGSTANVFPPTAAPAVADSPRSRKRTQPRSPSHDHPLTLSGTFERRVLTPKSPAARAASLTLKRDPTGYAASPHPPPQSFHGPRGRAYTAEPGPYMYSDVPPLPPLAVATRHVWPSPGFPSLVTGAAGPPRVAHAPEGLPRPLESVPPPPADPAPKVQPPYGPVDALPVSRPFQYGAAAAVPSHAPGAYRATSAGVMGAYVPEDQVHGPHEGYQTSHPSYQISIDTDHGPVVLPVEVDLQQASKLADEKRKRNAGASARFRARRKEKEKEASQTIAGLQQELREMAEQRDFYAAERNYFRDLAAQHVSHQLLQRPASPGVRRTATSTSTGDAGAAQASEAGSFVDDHAAPSPNVRRRRTGDYQPTFVAQAPPPTLPAHPPPPPPPPPSHAPLPPSGPGYALLGFPSQSPLPPLQPPPSLVVPQPPSSSSTGPTSYVSPRTLPPGLPAPPAVNQTPSYDPFRRELFDRPWGTGP